MGVMRVQNRSYKDLEKGEKEAKIGLDSEKEIMEMINTDMKFRSKILDCLRTLDFKINDIRRASESKDTKSDIFILSNIGKLGISIKTSTKTSFHQLDRRTLDGWKNYLEMPDDIYMILKKSILRVAENSRKAKFIIEEDREKVKNFFLENIESIITEIFTKSERNLRLFMVNNKTAKEIYVFRMDEVLKFLIQDASEISFSSKGIINLGNFITVQRKGGDGKHVKIPKSDWKHPGNNLQFKFSPLKFAEYVKDGKKIKFCIITY